MRTFDVTTIHGIVISSGDGLLYEVHHNYYYIYVHLLDVQLWYYINLHLCMCALRNKHESCIQYKDFIMPCFEGSYGLGQVTFTPVSPCKLKLFSRDVLNISLPWLNGIPPANVSSAIIELV